MFNRYNLKLLCTRKSIRITNINRLHNQIPELRYVYFFYKWFISTVTISLLGVLYIFFILTVNSFLSL